VKILETLQSRGLALKKVSNSKGGEWAGPCPACGGRDRFRCWPEARGTGAYWCRQCDAKGDLLQFFRDFEGLSFKDAAERAGKHMPTRARRSWRATPLPSTGAPSAAESGQPGQGLAQGSAPPGLAEWAPHEPETPPALWRQKAGKLVAWAGEQLRQSPEVLHWLETRRGLRSETAERYGLGWNPGKRGRDLYRPVTSWGLPFETNARGKERSIWLPLGLVLPVWSGDDLQRIKIRRPKQGDSLPPELAPPYKHGPKWARNAPFTAVRGGSDASMFLPGSGAGPAVVVVVEGELDALLLLQEAGHALGEDGGVLALGSAGNKPDARTFARLRQARHVLVALDCDDTPEEAGAKASRNWWLPMFPTSAKRWPVPEGKDPCEAWLAGVDLCAWIEAALAEAPGVRGRLTKSRRPRQEQARKGTGQTAAPVSTASAMPAMQEASGKPGREVWL